MSERMTQVASSGLSQETRKEAGEKIVRILEDDEQSRRPLDLPDDDSNKIWRLEDLLFETLGVLAE